MVLPTEIWRRIFLYLIPDGWNHRAAGNSVKKGLHKSLFNICLVCHLFRRIAQPLLYRTVFLVSRFGADREASLLRTLYTIPRLAESVRSLQLSDSVWHNANTTKSFEQDEVLASAIASLQIPPGIKCWLEEPTRANGDGEPDNLIALTLALTPNVQDASLDIYRQNECLMILLSGSTEVMEAYQNLIDEEVKEEAVQQSTWIGLPYLHKLSLSSKIDGPVTSMAEFELILLHPGLTHLELSRVTWGSYEISSMEWGGRTNNIQSLSFTESAIDHDSLRDIFTRCPKLRFLSISLATPHDVQDFEQHGFPEVPPWMFDAPRFGEALREYGQKLIEFSLKTETHRVYILHWGDMGNDGVLGSLRELESLRKLTVSMPDLIFDDEERKLVPWPEDLVSVLPPNLEELVITNWYGDRFEKIVDLAQRQCLTTIRRISIELSSGRPWVKPETVSEEIHDWRFFEEREYQTDKLYLTTSVGFERIETQIEKRTK